MTITATKFTGLVDYGQALRDIAKGAETASSTEPGIKLQKRGSAYWQDSEGDATDAVFVKVQVSDIVTDGGQSYTVVFYANHDATGPEAVELCRTPVTGPGSFTVGIDRSRIDASIPTANEIFLAVGVEMNGEGASITFGAWII